MFYFGVQIIDLFRIVDKGEKQREKMNMVADCQENRSDKDKISENFKSET